MSFQNLGALLWLLPLGGVIIILYLLKMKRRDLKVPATFLWPDKIEEVRANSLFQKLRFSWLLILQLLALCLIVFALARPQTKQTGLAGEITVIVLDTSASMGARDVKPSRLEVAKKTAADAIRSAKTGDRLAIIEAGPTPRVIMPLSNDPAKGIAALNNITQTDGESDVGEALRLSAAIVGNEQSARIVLLSDGTFEPIQDFSPGKASVIFQPIGEDDINLAINALGAAQTAAGHQLYYSVKNTGSKQLDGTISIKADGETINSQNIVVAPSKDWGETISYPAGTKVIEAFLDAPADLLQADNYAVVVTDPNVALNVLLISKGNLFLERALALDPRVTLDRASSVPVDQQSGDLGTAKYDIVVFDGVQETPVKARGILTFGSAGAPSPVTVQSASTNSGEFISAEPVDLLKGVDLRNVFIDHMQKVKPKPSGEVLAVAKSGPLVVKSEGVVRHLYVAFEPLQSDFPLQVSFPIFIANALDYLAGDTTSDALQLAVGSPFTIPATQTVTLTDPDGKSTQIEPLGLTATIREVRRAGRHIVSSGNTRKTIYAQLRSDIESTIEPRQELRLGNNEVTTTRAPSRFADFWKPLALLCLLVLCAEWWLYARRS